MTPKEIQKTLKFIRDDIGPDAYVSINISFSDMSSLREAAASATIYPTGLSGGSAVRVQADDWDSLFEKLNRTWADTSERHKAERIRKMALAIISITAKQGACTDAALRAGDFSDDEVQRYGDDAIADANEIASNGPFSITKLAGANAA